MYVEWKQSQDTNFRGAGAQSAEAARVGAEGQCAIHFAGLVAAHKRVSCSGESVFKRGLGS